VVKSTKSIDTAGIYPHEHYFQFKYYLLLHLLLIGECKFNSFTGITHMKKLGKLICIILFVEIVYAGIIIQSVKANIPSPETSFSITRVDYQLPHTLFSGFKESSWIIITLLIGYGVQYVSASLKEKKQEKTDP